MEKITGEQLPKIISACATMGQPLMVWGPPGCGKSNIFHQTAVNDGAFMVEVRLAQYDSVDLRGTLYVTEDKLTAWAAAATLPFMGNPAFPTDRPIYLFLDEIVQAMPAVQAVAFQLVLDGRIGEHILMPNVRVFAAGNKAGHRSGANRMLAALANRFMHVELEHSLDAWCQWAMHTNVDPMLIAFLRLRPDLLSTFLTSDGAATTDEAFASERSWGMVDRVLKQKFGRELQYPMLAGCVGRGPAAEFTAFLDLVGKMPDIDAIIASPENAGVPKDAAVLFAVTSALAHRATRGNFASVAAYGERLPKEFAVRMLKDCVTRNESLTRTATFASCVSKYKDVIW